MGQVLPLPNRIPFPDEIMRKEMYRYGIILDYNPKTPEKYVRYLLPEGWKIIKDTDKSKSHHPVFNIIDNDNIIRFIIFGHWTKYFKHSLSIVMI